MTFGWGQDTSSDPLKHEFKREIIKMDSRIVKVRKKRIHEEKLAYSIPTVRNSILLRERSLAMAAGKVRTSKDVRW